MPFFNPFSPNPKSQPQKQEPTDCYIPRADWNRGTYRELLAILQELPDSYLDQDVTVLDNDTDEYYNVGSIGFTGPGEQRIDPDSFFLTI